MRRASNKDMEKYKQLSSLPTKSGFASCGFNFCHNVTDFTLGRYDNPLRRINIKHYTIIIKHTTIVDVDHPNEKTCLASMARLRNCKQYNKNGGKTDGFLFQSNESRNLNARSAMHECELYLCPPCEDLVIMT